MLDAIEQIEVLEAESHNDDARSENINAILEEVFEADDDISDLVSETSDKALKGWPEGEDEESRTSVQDTDEDMEEEEVPDLVDEWAVPFF